MKKIIDMNKEQCEWSLLSYMLLFVIPVYFFNKKDNIIKLNCVRSFFWMISLIIPNLFLLLLKQFHFSLINFIPSLPIIEMIFLVLIMLFTLILLIDYIKYMYQCCTGWYKRNGMVDIIFKKVFDCLIKKYKIKEE